MTEHGEVSWGEFITLVLLFILVYFIDLDRCGEEITMLDLDCLDWSR